MTPFVPKFATMHSLISAWARCQRIDIKKKSLRGNQVSVLSHDLSLGYQIRKLVNEVFKGYYTPERLIEEHTQVPLYSNVMVPSQAMGWHELLTDERNVRDTKANDIRRIGLVESTTLRRCPTCVAEDFAKYGCAHWRVFHQWPVARHCAVHGDLLHSSCNQCHMPFVRGHQARLADDPCPHCGGRQGAADAFTPPIGYWPLLKLMYAALTGNSSDIQIIRQKIAEFNIQPERIGRGQVVTTTDRLVRRTCQAWDVETLSELAAALGVNWIWFNEFERSAGLRECPPMVKLALVSNGSDIRMRLEAANDEYVHLPWAA